MRYRSLFLASLLVLGLGAPNAANAQCVGFTDTADDVFCPAVEWLKNRSITSGCTATEFCPSSPVSRLAMAQFINRLGKAMTPVVLFAEAQHGNLTVAESNGATVLCVTPAYTPGFPRTARFAGQFFGHPSGVAAFLQGRFKYTTNDGGTWQFVGAGSVVGRGWAGVAEVAGSSVFGAPLALVPGTTYRFGLGVDGMGASASFSAIECQTMVTIDNANPASSPLDE